MPREIGQTITEIEESEFPVKEVVERPLTVKRHTEGLYYVHGNNVPECLQGRYTTLNRAEAAITEYLDQRPPARVKPDLAALFPEIPSKKGVRRDSKEA